MAEYSKTTCIVTNYSNIFAIPDKIFNAFML